ncbi:bifunctional phosphopantothenoylcysteine decarboxylase/phosphopantothenate--cysteine ligase CoaBC [Actinomyces gaoshouyii]|uniref:bifunctional phosphopantothenoylcysteine decarboxylase/phosphopantothenate--cysteine ligase CoaBC n=1 Tax=Actinomyces gaoshouyii TaxID=1960083 RepID=UPI0009BFBFD4|nr:bifunctional phosphopantothenoylcysteine decarboxylase/phosphopantothenate--cysteine ligase CoaBC [Actinomyces gaoshouyii]ARD41667.1 phosphopantothenoylcysteine decarboxylase [Actinomyces gaoshouyii]
MPQRSEGARRAATPTGPWRVVVGVAGSIAAYKAPTVIRLLRAQGHETRAVATQAALRFIGAPALAAVSGRPVDTDVFDDPAAVEHVGLGEWAELVLVAPASADLLARIAAGRADDLLTATILTTTAPVVLAPAMHTQMWANAATVENVATLRRRGLTIIEPDVGPLTSGDSGAGRLPAPERIVAEALAVPAGATAAVRRTGAGGPGTACPEQLSGRRLVVSAGGTHEPIDPVRFIGNRSSGRQGVAIASAAAARGADVVLIAANISPEVLAPLGESTAAPGAGTARIVEAPTALDMEAAVRSEASSADAVVMAAAVADFRPSHPGISKIKKHRLADGAGPATGGADEAVGPAGGPAPIELVANPDILAGLVADPPQPGQLIVGFAAETGDEEGDALAHGAAKARRKGAHLLAVNAVGDGRGFGDVPNAVVVLDPQGAEVARGEGTKAEVAELLLDLIAERLPR